MSTLQKKYANVVDDCTKALEHNNRYIKALFRRAKAAEVTSNLMQCLEGDLTNIFSYIFVSMHLHYFILMLDSYSYFFLQNRRLANVCLWNVDAVRYNCCLHFGKLCQSAESYNGRPGFERPWKSTS